MRSINKGENLIIRRSLKKADGTALLLADVTTLSVSIMQGGEIIETLTYPSVYLRQGESTSQLELEISTANSNKFKKGTVSLKYTIVAVNADFTGEGSQTDIIEEPIINVK